MRQSVTKGCSVAADDPTHSAGFIRSYWDFIGVLLSVFITLVLILTYFILVPCVGSIFHYMHGNRKFRNPGVKTLRGGG